MIHNKFRYLLTLLALTLFGGMGAWAQGPTQVTQITTDMIASWQYESSYVTLADLQAVALGFEAVDENTAMAWTGAPQEAEYTYLVYGFNEGDGKLNYILFNNGKVVQPIQSPYTKSGFYYDARDYKVFYTGSPEPAGPKVTWDAATKTGTFTMPAYDVEIAPIYAPAAQWAKVENVDQIPAAIEGIFAGTTDAIVKAGTVAMMGKTENPQGIVMYAVTSTNQATAPELSAFSATVPTAENIADEGADVLVWYYIQGANTPDGEEATAENTFNDSEICTTPIKVTVLSNKFDITFNAANANTIEAGKATVTVGGAAATVTEGKLEGVKMGSEVKMTAKDGYKFKKVEAKKKSVGPVLNLTNPAVGQLIGDDGKNYNYGAVPMGVTALAKICHISGDHGVALALKDYGIDGFVSWNTVKAALETYEPKFTNATWDMPTEDEWSQMNHTAGGYGALRDSFNAVGGTNMTDGAYWSSTSDPNDDTKAKNFSFNNGEWGSYQKSANRFTRLRLAW